MGFPRRGEAFDATLKHFLEIHTQITNHLSMMEFFEQVQERFLEYGKNSQKRSSSLLTSLMAFLRSALKGFLHAFRHTISLTTPRFDVRIALAL